AEDVRKQQLVSVPVRIEGFIEADFCPGLAIPPQVHQDLVFDTPRGVRCQFDLFRRVERVDCLDETDGPDGDQVFNRHARIFKLARDINDEPQIPFDQYAADGTVARAQPIQKVHFLFGRQGRWQHFAGADVMHLDMAPAQFARHLYQSDLQQQASLEWSDDHGCPTF